MQGRSALGADWNPDEASKAPRAQHLRSHSLSGANPALAGAREGVPPVILCPRHLPFLIMVLAPPGAKERGPAPLLLFQSEGDSCGDKGTQCV